MQFRRIPYIAATSRIAVALVLGCGSSGEKKDDQGLADLGSGDMNTAYQPGSHRLGDDDGSDTGGGMKVDLEQGSLDQFEVEETLRKNFRRLTRCYDRAGDAQQFVGGKINLRFMVEPGGEVSDVLVIENELGNYAIERCLVVELRDIKFRAPGGRKGANFEYPLQFESTREVAVVDWPRGLIAEDVDPLLVNLSSCPPLGSSVFAVAYIDSSGSIASAGLESNGPIDPTAGMCALEQMQGWRLKGEPGHVIRTSFRLRIPDPSRLPLAAPAVEPPKARKGSARGGKRPGPGRR